MVSKEMLLESVKDLPEMIDKEDLFEKIIILDKYEKGLKDIKQGNSRPFSGFREEFQVWKEK